MSNHLRAALSSTKKAWGESNQESLLVESKLVAEGEVLEGNRRMTFSKQPNQAKQTKEKLTMAPDHWPRQVCKLLISGRPECRRGTGL
jgi:hypothetical protein